LDEIKSHIFVYIAYCYFDMITLILMRRDLKYANYSEVPYRSLSPGPSYLRGLARGATGGGLAALDSEDGLLGLVTPPRAGVVFVAVAVFDGVTETIVGSAVWAVVTVFWAGEEAGEANTYTEEGGVGGGAGDAVAVMRRVSCSESVLKDIER
jgi:hypothetical protein